VIKKFNQYKVNEALEFNDHGKSFVDDCFVTIEDIIGDVEITPYFYSSTSNNGSYDWAKLDGDVHMAYRIYLDFKEILISDEDKEEYEFDEDPIAVDYEKMDIIFSEICNIRKKLESHGFKFLSYKIGNSFFLYFYYANSKFNVPDNLSKISKSVERFESEMEAGNYFDDGWVFEFSSELSCYLLYNLTTNPNYIFRNSNITNELLSKAEKILTDFKSEIYLHYGHINITNKKVKEIMGDEKVIAAFFPPKEYLEYDKKI
jgi:hypothetical protein